MVSGLADPLGCDPARPAPQGGTGRRRDAGAGAARQGSTRRSGSRAAPAACRGGPDARGPASGRPTDGRRRSRRNRVDDEVFWALVDEAIAREAATGGVPGVAGVAGGALSEVLADRLPPDEVLRFSRHADVVAARAATWDLLAACHLIDGWHTDDAFRDFRDVLVLAGRAVLRAGRRARGLARGAAGAGRGASSRSSRPWEPSTTWRAARGPGSREPTTRTTGSRRRRLSSTTSARTAVDPGPAERPGRPWTSDELRARLPALVSLVHETRP